MFDSTLYPFQRLSKAVTDMMWDKWKLSMHVWETALTDSQPKEAFSGEKEEKVNSGSEDVDQSLDKQARDRIRKALARPQERVTD